MVRFARAGTSAATTVLVALSLGAASPDAAGPAQPPDPQLQAVAQEFSFSLLQIVAQIEQHYVRPVSRADLIEAGIIGLYDAVRQPVPATLHQDVQRASDAEMRALLVRSREALGDHDALRGQRALLVSLNALPRALDPYCGLTGPKEFQVLDQNDRGPHTGLEFPLTPGMPSFARLMPDGVRLGQDPMRPLRASIPGGPVRVTGVQPGSPGQKAGVLPGDLVIAVDGRPPEDPGFAAAFQRLLPIRVDVPSDFGSLTSAVKLRLLRPERADPFDVTIVPAVFRAESIFGAQRRLDGSWNYMLDSTERIGYIRIGLIHLHSHSEFADAIKSLRSMTLGGLVLDLRWCPGGYLKPSATIARQLLGPERAVIASQRDKNGQVSRVPANPVEMDATDFPIVVLVNGATSGGGELIAAALQDHGRAAVAGQRTSGKSSVQEPLDQFGIPLKITTSLLLRPKNREPDAAPAKLAEEWTVRPDPGREILGSAELSRQLKTWWMLHTLRPVGSTQALPIDDPENDPQRQAAVQMLRGLMGR
jgi:carboxyl-terminal processing protease